MNRRLRFLLLLLISYAGAQSLLRLILFFTSWRETSLLPIDLLGTFACGSSKQKVDPSTGASVRWFCPLLC